MALILADRVRETTTSTGTGSITLAGALTGFQTFSTAVGDGNTTYYVIAGQGTSEWEVGIGTYASAGNTLARTTVLASSNAGSLVGFSAGTKDIWVDYAAGKAVTTDTLAYPPAIGGTTPAAGTFTTLTANTTSIQNTGANSGLTLLRNSDSGNNSTRIFLDASGGVASIYNNANTIRFQTGATIGTSSGALQLNVAHTASAVNYVQVTGAATTVAPQIVSAGSDTNVGFSVSSKGTGTMSFYTNSANANSRHLDVTHTSTVVNRFQLTGSQTGIGVTLGVNGTDTNISQVFQSKGTGAIDLAAGSSGVNISNGGTVTAITRTATGANNYTSIPALAISAPTTAGGVQATATPTMYVGAATIQSGGSGYTVNDTITLSGGTFTSAATFTVSSVSAGVITGITLLSGGAGYSVLPTNPVSVTGGTGTGATLNITGYGVSTTFNITNAGSGYVEQPTVSFSGGGGSGAAAYATVGSGTVIRALGATGNQTLDFYTPVGISSSVPNFRLRDNATADSYPMTNNLASIAAFIAQGNANASLVLGANGSGGVRITTNGTSLTEQLRVAHTASAVNYVQVTGAATANPPVISSQGSDATIAMLYQAKGGQDHRFFSNSGSAEQFRVIHTAGTIANQTYVTGAVAGAAPIFGVRGSDTNIDLTLTPKGTGVVQFGSFTSSVGITSTGYITIKDSGGTTRRLLVG